jgi:capsular exopolysaccharide synthesis family protein
VDQENKRLALVAPRDLAPANQDPLPGRGDVFWEEDESGRLRSQVLFLWRLIAKWRWLILGATLAGILLGMVATLLTTPIFRGTSTLEIDKEAQKIVNVEGLQPTLSEQGPEFMETQYGLLKSRSLAERVVRSLNLAADPRFFRVARSTKIGGGGSSSQSSSDAQLKIEKATDRLMEGLVVTPVRASRLVSVSFDSPDRVIAALVTNSVAENFIRVNLERRYQASSFARQFLDSRLAEVRQKLEDSERQLAAYATNQQIINVGGGRPTKTDPSAEGAQSLTAADLDSMNRALAEAQQTRILAEQRWRQAEATTGLGLPELQQSASIQTLRDLKATLSADYQDKLKVFKPEHSTMVQLRARMDEIDRQLAAQTGSVKESLQAQYQVALNNENALAGKVAGLKSKFLDLQNRSIRYNIIQRDVDTSRTFYEGLLEREKEVAVAGVGTNNVSIIDSARIPRHPIKPRPVLNLALAGFMGLLAGVALAFGLEQLDQSLKTPDDVETRLGLPLLGAIPIVDGTLAPFAALSDPRSAISEAYNSLRTALELSTTAGCPSTLLITSAQPAEGKSTTAAALARSLASLGNKVLVIDADLRNSTLHRIFGGHNRSGLSNLLAGFSSLEAEVQSTSVNNLTLLAAGPSPPNAAELLSGGKLRPVLAHAANEFEYVVIDGPPIMGLADAILLANAAGGTILVVQAGKTGRQLAMSALKRIDRSRAHVLGALLTKFNFGSLYGGDYTYSYDYAADRAPKGALGRLGQGFRKLLGRS